MTKVAGRSENKNDKDIKDEIVNVKDTIPTMTHPATSGKAPNRGTESSLLPTGKITPPPRRRRNPGNRSATKNPASVRERALRQKSLRGTPPLADLPDGNSVPPVIQRGRCRVTVPCRASPQRAVQQRTIQRRRGPDYQRQGAHPRATLMFHGDSSCRRGDALSPRCRRIKLERRCNPGAPSNGEPNPWFGNESCVGNTGNGTRETRHRICLSAGRHRGGR